MNNICFIIAHKYFRGYKNYTDYYIENIKKAYGDQALSIIVDNNSQFKDESFDRFKHLPNVTLLDNNIKSKFEVGGYQVGLQHVLDNDLKENYEYYVFTQDTFILKNKYDFNNLLQDNIWACPINSMPYDGSCMPQVVSVLNELGLFDNLNKISFVWANSFIVHKSRIEKLQEYLKQIVCTTKTLSHGAERFLARIMYELNDHGKNVDIDGDLRHLLRNHYDCHTVDPFNPVTTHFVKTIQNKNEGTRDR